MRYQFYREHKYVSAALNDLERLIAQTDFSDLACLAEVKRAFASLSEMLKGHAHYENERLHALLKKKNSLLYAHAEEDHAAQDQQILDIEELIDRISQESDEKKRVERGYGLYLAYRKFVSDNLAHLHEEETQILPELQRLYSDSELQQVEASTYLEMSPEEIVHMLQILFPHMNAQDRRAMLFDVLSLVPDKFDCVWSAIQPILADKERVQIERNSLAKK